MSRVEEALKRASEKGLPSAGRVVDTPSIEMAGSATVDHYPAELAAVRHTRRELPRSAIAAPRAGTARPLTRLGQEVDGKVVVDDQTSAESIEQYRRLAAALHQVQAESKLRTLMVSSALPRDGKTLTSTNLALTLSESFKRRVLLIDADLRRPSIHTLFRLPNTRGLADGLKNEHGAQLPLIEVTPKLTILPAGGPDPSPMAGLLSERMQAILQEAAERFDWVLIDTAPVGLIADGHLLASVVDGVLLVIGAGTTDYRAVKRTVDELGRDRIVGVVLNRVPGGVSQANSYQYYQDPAGSDVESSES
jgi:capsular exopolysaccharide synthesis family protein